MVCLGILSDIKNEMHSQYKWTYINAQWVIWGVLPRPVKVNDVTPKMLAMQRKLVWKLDGSGFR